jgi:hypothetical protein
MCPISIVPLMFLQFSEPAVNRAAWILISVCCVFPSCGGMDVTSTFRDRAIAIDADARDWAGLSLHTEKNVSFAVCNDSTYIYILLTTSERSLQRQFSGMGVNLWFDANGGSDKTFGIHYPVRTPGERQTPAGDERAGMEGGPGEPPRMMEAVSNDMEILGPGKDDRMIVSLAEAKDIQLKMSSVSGQLVFELRVPLVRDPLHPHGIGVTIADNVGVGLETPKFDLEGMRERMGTGMRPPGGQGGGTAPGEGGGGMPQGGGARGGRGGGRGSPGGPGGGGPGGNTPASVSLWANVKLAGK